MLKYVNIKQKYYRLLNSNKQIINTSSYDKYTIYHLLLKKHYRVNIGDVTFIQKTNTILMIGKPFKFLSITRKPKSYPFKVLKT